MKRHEFVGYDNPFATRLRMVMESKECKQYILAEAIGSNRQSVSQYMDGSILPRADKLAAMADFLGVSSDFLLGRDTYSTDSDKNILKLDAVEKALGDLYDYITALERLFIAN